MAVKIKLTRIGKKNFPKYRIVVVDGRKKRDGKYIEKIGLYDPVPDPYVLKVNQEKLNSWLKKGAQVSEGLRKLLKF
jgi:small subunit ribosomal protein S16